MIKTKLVALFVADIQQFEKKISEKTKTLPRLHFNYFSFLACDPKTAPSTEGAVEGAFFFSLQADSATSLFKAIFKSDCHSEFWYLSYI